MNKIFIVGMPASGKTYLAKWLSNSLQWNFIDLDKQIEDFTGDKIVALFNKIGEKEFRKIETEQLQLLKTKKDIVVATGGGLACYNSNMDWMLENGLTIYNYTKLSTLTNRILGNNTARPMFLGLSKEEIKLKLVKLEEEREFFYGKSKIIYPSSSSKFELLNTVNQLLSLYLEMKF